MVRTRKLLFETQVPQRDQQPFFKSAYELARYLVASQLVRGKTTARSLGNFLVQVMRGERNLPKKYEEAILEAVERRLADSEASAEAREVWVRDVQGAIRSDAEERRKPVALDADELYYELVRWSQTAASQFIVTERPAEIVGSPHAHTLNEILLNRLGLNQLATDGRAGTPKARYTFNFPSKDIGELFWSSIEHTIERNAQFAGRVLEPGSLLQALEELEKSGHLVAYALTPEMCVYPTVVFDVEAPTSAGFVFYYHGGEDENVSVAKMDPHSLQHWKEHFLLTIHRRLRKKPKPDFEQVLVRATLAPDHKGHDEFLLKGARR